MGFHVHRSHHGLSGSIFLVLAVALALPAGLAWAGDGDDWTRVFTGSSTEWGVSVISDGNGGAYTAGFFTGTSDFDPGPGTVEFTATDVGGMYLVRLNASGNLVWARGITAPEAVGPGALARDRAGTLYVVGAYRGTVDFDPGPGVFELTTVGSATSDYDVFVLKLTAAGDFIWARSMGGSQIDYGWGIAVDPAGNVYTTGGFRSTADFDPGLETFSLTSPGATTSTIFVSKLTSEGDFGWAKMLGGASNDEGRAIGLDAQGNVYVTGRYQATGDFNPGPDVVEMTSEGSNDVFLTKLDSDGEFVWTRSMGGTGMEQGESLAIDAFGNLLVTGYFAAIGDFDPGPGVVELTPVSVLDLFVLKLESAGVLEWARAMTSTGGGNIANAVAVDGAGNVYSTGEFRETADFDPGVGSVAVASAGERDIYLSKLSPDGDYLDVRTFGGTGNDYGEGVAVDTAGNVFLTARFEGTIDLDSGPGVTEVTSTGEFDTFVMKFAMDGDAAPCTPVDINCDSAVNAVDIQLVINAALGLTIAFDADVDASGGITAVDIQLVINAALGV